MESAELERTTVDIAARAGSRLLELRATGQVIKFDGFLKLYQEGRDDDGDEEDSRRLPVINEGEALRRKELAVTQHFTEPPPRFSEASLVKRMEELGIGRPSTYASILQVLKDRGYVKLEKKRLHGEDKGRVVVASSWRTFSPATSSMISPRISRSNSTGSPTMKSPGSRCCGISGQVSSARSMKSRICELPRCWMRLTTCSGRNLRSARRWRRSPAVPSCGAGKLNLKAGNFGAFVGCSNYPECRYTRPLAADSEASADRILGQDPETGRDVVVKAGRFGPYIQLGEPKDYAEGEKPKRAGIPKTSRPATSSSTWR